MKKMYREEDGDDGIDANTSQFLFNHRPDYSEVLRGEKVTGCQ